LFAKHGGRYVGGAAAETYYNDPDYAPVRAIRWEATQSELILIDGYEG
jgi:uncharacterized protein (DUF1330 family)